MLERVDSEKAWEVGKEKKRRGRKHRAGRREEREERTMERQTVFQDNYKISHPTHSYNRTLTLLPLGDGIYISSPRNVGGHATPAEMMSCHKR